MNNFVQVNLSYNPSLKFIIPSLILLFALNSSYSQDYVTLTANPSKKEFAAGENIRINLKASIQDGFHINANKIEDEDLIPTTIKLDESDFKLVKVSWPSAKSYRFSFSETELQVYEETVNIGLTLKLKKDLKPGKYNISGSVHYQACNDRACFAPRDVEFTVLVVIKEDTLKSSIDKKVDTGGVGVKIDTPKTNVVAKEKFDTAKTLTSVDDKNKNEISGYLQEKGLFLTLILIFLGGLALNLTPCVYPIIPITVSYFGAQVSNNKAQQILMSIIYVLGMSVTYSILGLVAALTGGLFGSALQNPIVVLIIAGIMVALALSMFGLYEIRIPQSLAAMGGKNRQGYIGTAMMGLTVGFIAAPCIGPFVLSLLVYVGQIGDALIGFVFFFILSLGLGLPFVFLAVFSNSISKLPRSGEWMEGVKVIFGLILVGLAIYTLQTLIPKNIYEIIFPLFIILAGIYLIIVDKKALNSVVYTKIKYVIAVVGITYGSVNFNTGDESNQTAKFHWQYYNTKSEIERSIQSANGMPTMIDFNADWCAACKELDKYTYTNPRVIELSKKFNNIKVDLTKENKEISDKYKILGLPVVAFIDKNGNELQNLRVTGFVEPEEFSNVMEKALSN